MTDLMKVEKIIAEPIYGETWKTSDFKLTLVTDEGMAVEYHLARSALESFADSLMGVYFQLAARFPNEVRRRE